MKTVCIAPFDKTCRAFITESNTIGLFNGAIVLPAYDRCSDVSELFAGAPIGLSCLSDYISVLDECDAIIITDCPKEHRRYLEGIIAASIDRNMHIYIYNSSPDILSQLIDDDSRHLVHLPSIPYSFSQTSEWAREGFSTPPCPCIHIVSLCAGLDTFELLCHVNGVMRRHGIGTIALSDNLFCDAFGLCRMNLSPSTEQEILQINACVQELTYRSHPDMVVIEHPNPVTSYSEYVHYDFGLSSHALFRAVPPDIVLCCIPLNLADPAFLEECSYDVAAESGISKCTFLVGDQMVDDSNQVELHSLGICHSSDTVTSSRTNALRSAGLPAYTLRSESEAFEFDKHLWELLADEGMCFT